MSGLTRIRSVCAATFIVFGVLIASGPAAAARTAPDRQAADALGRWVIPYMKGLDALKKQQWESAVPLLQQAIQIDPVPGESKRVESTVTQDYFPQFYLFYAFVKLKQFDRARAFVSSSRPSRPIATDVTATIDEFNAWQATTAKRAADQAAAAKAADEAARIAAQRMVIDKVAAERATAEARHSDTRATDSRAAVLAEFDALILRGNTALAARKYLDALNAYDAACAKLPDEFQRRGLQSRVDAVVRVMTTAPVRPRP